MRRAGLEELRSDLQRLREEATGLSTALSSEARDGSRAWNKGPKGLPNMVLGGSWDLVTRVISKAIYLYIYSYNCL